MIKMKSVWLSFYVLLRNHREWNISGLLEVNALVQLFDSKRTGLVDYKAFLRFAFHSQRVNKSRALARFGFMSAVAHLLTPPFPPGAFHAG